METDSLGSLSTSLFVAAFSTYLAAALAAFLRLAMTRQVLAHPREHLDRLAPQPAPQGRTATVAAWATAALTALGIAVHGASVVTRGLAAQRFPWANMFEYSSMVALAVAVAGLLFVHWRLRQSQLMGFVLALVLATMTSALLLFTEPGPVVPALDTFWLRLHTTAAILASAVFPLGFVFTVLQLVADHVERRTAGRTPPAADRPDGGEPGWGDAVAGRLTPLDLAGAYDPRAGDSADEGVGSVPRPALTGAVAGAKAAVGARFTGPWSSAELSSVSTPDASTTAVPDAVALGEDQRGPRAEQTLDQPQPTPGAVAGWRWFAGLPALVVGATVLTIARDPFAAVATAGAVGLLGALLRLAVPVLPSSQTLDTLAYRTTAFGFPIWTLAVVLGAVWAEQAWGRYWGWDPKETAAAFTWVLYAAYLHARATRGWRGRRAAWTGIGAYAALLVTYFAVNLWVVGLHSYAGVS